MAFDLQYRVDPATVGRLTQRTATLQGKHAQTQLATQLALQEIQAEQNQQRIDQQAEQFDDTLRMRSIENASRQNLYRDQLAASAYNNALDNQRMLASEQLQQAGAFDRAQLAQQGELEQQYLDYETAGVDVLNDEASKIMTEMRKKSLDPEGQTHLHKLAADLRAIQGAPLRPRQRQQAMSEWFRRYEQTNLDQYEEQPPDPESEWQLKTRTDEFGRVYGIDRNGTWRKIGDPPPRPLKPEEVTQNTMPLPNGGYLFINPVTGKEVVIPPAKEEGPDIAKYRDTAYTSLKEEHANKHALSDKPPAFDPSVDEIASSAVKLWEAEQKAQELIAAKSKKKEQAPIMGSGSPDDPIQTAGVKQDVLADIISKADSGTVFVDDQGRRFVKP